MGGNSPQSLVNATAIEIQSGEIDIAVLAGGEATRSRHRARTAGIDFDWPKSEPGDEPRIIGEDLQMNLEAETDARHLDADTDLPDVRDRDPSGVGPDRR